MMAVTCSRLALFSGPSVDERAAVCDSGGARRGLDGAAALAAAFAQHDNGRFRSLAKHCMKLRLSSSCHRSYDSAFSSLASPPSCSGELEPSINKIAHTFTC